MRRVLWSISGSSLCMLLIVIVFVEVAALVKNGGEQVVQFVGVGVAVTTTVDLLLHHVVAGGVI